MPLLVPNEHPSISLDYRLAIIGEAPGADEEKMGKPFVGTSGRLLHALLSQNQILRSSCFLGNIAQTRPNENKIENFAWNGPEIQGGLAALKEDLAAFDPNACLLLGATPLRAAGIDFNVSSYRGTIFQCRDTDSPFFGRKCISTVHPAFVLRSYDFLPLFAFDITRAKEESFTPHYQCPQRLLEVELSVSQICDRLDAIPDGSLVSLDIEGGVQQGITCVGIALSASHSFIVNVLDFGDDEKVRILKALSRILANPRIRKVLQNSLYDNFCLAWKWKMPILGVEHDTMLSGWEIYPELPKGLDTQSSIYTKEPYYKFQRKVNDKLTHYRYCCTDAAVTYEIHEKHSTILTKRANDHYRFNMDLLPSVHYMELRGIRYDIEKAKARLVEVNGKMAELSKDIDKHAGEPLNPNSPKQMIKCLYTKLGFEPQYKKEHGRRTTSLTADVEALLNLAKSNPEGIINSILKWRVLEGQRKQLEILPDADGRIRCGYNLVGTETGRLSCYESPTGNGTNLQTIMKKNRDLFVADPDHYFFQCDLSGADGWTVAAHCTKLGDPTMQQDYEAQIKPARVIAAMHTHGFSIAPLPIPELKAAIARTKINEGLYFTCKRVQHGSNYQMGKNTMSTVILKDFWKLEGEIIYVTPKECEALQSLYLRGRYKGITKWHDWVKRELERTRTLGCASGHVRTFFGRPGDLETLKAALSHEPQANTTYATNLALHKLWHDSDNRRSDGTLIIEPLHQVHDALCGQFPKPKLEWALAKIRSYFANPLSIANQQLTIPFEGYYGASWGELKEVI